MNQEQLEIKSISDLREIAKLQGVKSAGKYRKTELVEIIMNGGVVPDHIAGKYAPAKKAEPVQEEAPAPEQAEPVQTAPEAPATVSEEPKATRPVQRQQQRKYPQTGNYSRNGRRQTNPRREAFQRNGTEQAVQPA